MSSEPARRGPSWRQGWGGPPILQLSLPGRIASAPAATLLAYLVQRMLVPTPGIAPFVFFYVGIVLASWMGGRLAGLLAVACSAAVANYSFVEPPGWSTSDAALRVTFLFVVAGSTVALLCAAFRDSVLAARRTAETMARQADMLELSHDAILVWRFDGGIESWSRGAEELYGYGAGEARGRLPETLLQTAFPTSAARFREELRAQGRWEGELVHRARSGERVTVAAKVQLVRTGDGVEWVLETNRDITDRQRAEAERERLLSELQGADRRKNEFLAVLSHELRNPLAPVRNSIYIMERAAPGSEQSRRALRIIDRQVQHLTRLIDDLLDINRISSGKVRLQREVIALNAIVRGAADDLREMFDQSGIHLEVSVPGDALLVRADRTRIAQVVGNLLQNAAKFTPRDGWTRLSLCARDGEAVIEVRDSGPGLETDLQPKLFTSFVQGERTIDRSRGGLGLGLALVKGLVELHGGTVAAFSEGVGKGALFVIRLPLAVDDTVASLAAASPSGRRCRRVLVIEDDADSATSLEEALELGGHRVALAFSGAEGLEKARTMLPDIVLCDVGLPEMDGYEVARAIRADPRLRATLLVALSGHALPADVERSEEAGFDRHVAKPLGMEQLEELMAESSQRAPA